MGRGSQQVCDEVIEFGGRGSGVEGVEERDEKRGNGNARVFIA